MTASEIELTTIQLKEVKGFFEYTSASAIAKDLYELFLSYLIDPDRIDMIDIKRMAADNRNMAYVISRIIGLLEILEPKY